MEATVMDRAAMGKRARADTSLSGHHASVMDRADRGKRARAEVPRSSHADWAPPKDRPDPVEILERQDEARLPELVP